MSLGISVVRMVWSIHLETASKGLDNERRFLRRFSSYPIGWRPVIVTQSIGPDPSERV